METDNQSRTNRQGINTTKHRIFKKSRSKNPWWYLNAIKQNSLDDGSYENFKVQFNRLEWLMPYVTVADKIKINLLNSMNKNIIMSYRTWELYEYPMLPANESKKCENDECESL